MALVGAVPRVFRASLELIINILNEVLIQLAMALDVEVAHNSHDLVGIEVWEAGTRTSDGNDVLVPSR